MRRLQNQLVSRSGSSTFPLLLWLLFFVQTTATIIGRAYYHLIGLHADTLTNSAKSLLLPTLVVPCFVLLTSRRLSHGSILSFRMIHAGLWLWCVGATISTLAHRENPVVVLNYAAGIGSGLAVFYAVRSLNLKNILHLEAVFAVIAVGGLIPTVQSIVGYLAAKPWEHARVTAIIGTPSLSALLQGRTEADKWSVLGNVGHASAFFGLLASICLAVLVLKIFTKAVRWVAAVALLFASVALVFCMSRAALAVFALSCLLAFVFVRNRKALFFSAALVILLTLVLPGPAASTLQNHFPRALKYDVAADRSAAERAESIQGSWREFIDHPFIGLGASQSPTVVKQGTAHELAAWQATEHGVLGLLGVLVITGACMVRLFNLLRAGAASQRLRLEFAFIFGPAMYFFRGLFFDVPINNTVVNTWVCLAFAMLALADAQTMEPLAAGVEPALRRESFSEAPTLVEAGSRTL